MAVLRDIGTEMMKNVKQVLFALLSQGNKEMHFNWVSSLFLFLFFFGFCLFGPVQTIARLG